MQGTVVTGKLVYFVTDRGNIEFKIRSEQDASCFAISKQIDLNGWAWDDLIGNEVEAIVVNGTTKSVM